MSADTTPISPARFAAALKDLSMGMLHLKVLEIRNSIAHLQYSNDQLRPFAEGAAVASSTSSPPATGQQDDAAAAAAPDQDCVDAIRENEQVIDRMAERIALVRAEVEERGASWAEFQSKEETEAGLREVAAASAQQNGHREDAAVDGEPSGTPAAETRSPWTDGTFQTGMIRNGEVRLDSRPGRGDGGGGRLDDEELSRALRERMGELGDGDDDGMHL